MVIPFQPKNKKLIAFTTQANASLTWYFIECNVSHFGNLPN